MLLPAGLGGPSARSQDLHHPTTGPRKLRRVDGIALRALAAVQPSSPASAELVALAERALSIYAQQAELEQQARAAGVELQTARAERQGMDVDAALGDEAPPADRKRADQRVQRAEAALETAAERRGVLAQARARAEADVARHLQAYDETIAEEHNALVLEHVGRLRDHLGAAVDELETLRGLTGAGHTHLHLAGRGLERIASERMELFERALETVVAQAGDERLAPLVPRAQRPDELEAEEPAVAAESDVVPPAKRARHDALLSILHGIPEPALQGAAEPPVAEQTKPPPGSFDGGART